MDFVKKLILIVASLSLVFSCTTVKEDHIKSTGVVHLPNPETRLVLEFDKDDIAILGEINISREFSKDYFELSLEQKPEKVVSNYGYLYYGDIPIIDTSNTNFSDNEKQQMLSAIIFDVIEQYPEMEYILFPKLYIKTTATNEEKKIVINLRGKATKLIFDNNEE